MKNDSNKGITIANPLDIEEAKKYGLPFEGWGSVDVFRVALKAVKADAESRSNSVSLVSKPDVKSNQEEMCRFVRAIIFTPKEPEKASVGSVNSTAEHQVGSVPVQQNDPLPNTQVQNYSHDEAKLLKIIYNPKKRLKQRRMAVKKIKNQKILMAIIKAPLDIQLCISAVQCLKNTSDILEVFKMGVHSRIRIVAVEKIYDTKLLKEILITERDCQLRTIIERRLDNLLLQSKGIYTVPPHVKRSVLLQILKSTDEKWLMKVAIDASVLEHGVEAVKKIHDAAALCDIAQRAKLFEVALRAVREIKDPNLLSMIVHKKGMRYEVIQDEAKRLLRRAGY